MAKPFRKLEIELNGTRYVLNRAASEMLLGQMDAFGGECSEACKRMREDLRAALATETEEPEKANPFDDESDGPEVTEEHTFVLEIAKGAVKAVAKENAEACGDCRVPRCRFCNAPGERAGGRKDGSGRTVERYYVCRTENCIAARAKVPQPAKIFAGGEA
jgi:hypothetical protein